jgi:hypothetical protein
MAFKGPHAVHQTVDLDQPVGFVFPSALRVRRVGAKAGALFREPDAVVQALVAFVRLLELLEQFTLSPARHPLAYVTEGIWTGSKRVCGFIGWLPSVFRDRACPSIWDQGPSCSGALAGTDS